MSLLVVGLNHKTASIDIRETMSVPENNIQSVVKSMCESNAIDGCNKLCADNNSHIAN